MMETLGGGTATAEPHIIVTFPDTHFSTCIHLSVRRRLFLPSFSFFGALSVSSYLYNQPLFIGIFNKRHLGLHFFLSFLFLLMGGGGKENKTRGRAVQNKRDFLRRGVVKWGGRLGVGEWD